MTKIIESKKIKAIAFDCDGVLTDGTVFYVGHDLWSRTYYIPDGLGIRKLLEAGIQVAVITTSNSEDIRKRIAKLKIPHFYEGDVDKTGAWKDFLSKTGLTAEEVAYMGDDDMDLPLLEACGFAITVPAGIPKAKELAQYVTQAEGGKGAVREVCELLLSHRNN